MHAFKVVDPENIFLSFPDISAQVGLILKLWAHEKHHYSLPLIYLPCFLPSLLFSSLPFPLFQTVLVFRDSHEVCFAE